MTKHLAISPEAAADRLAIRELIEAYAHCACRDFGLWLHVDGAYGGMAAIVPEMRHVLDGCQGADSIVVNPHKWLFTPLDCSALYVRHPDTLQRSFSLVPEYLKSHEEDVYFRFLWSPE